MQSAFWKERDGLRLDQLLGTGPRLARSQDQEEALLFEDLFHVADLLLNLAA